MFNLDQSANKEIQTGIINHSFSIIQRRLKETTDLQTTAETALKWIQEVFENSAKLSQNESLLPAPPTPIDLPREISAFTIQTVIRILTAISDPLDNSLYYLSHTGAALGVYPKEMRNLLDTEFNKLRFEFTERLKEELDNGKLYWCALILMKIICADGKIHPAEKRYFDIIEELIKGSEHSLESLKKTALENSELPKLELNQGSAQSMLKYVVTIAMSDGEFVGQESEFIKKAATCLGVESSQIDAILQPVASSFMVLKSLFPREE